MIDAILQAAPGGAWPERCPAHPALAHIVYFDDVEADGPDNLNMFFRHNVTVELYEPTREDSTYKAIEAELNTRGIRYSKMTRRWQSNLQLYQTIYDFSYIEKE